MMRDDNSKIVNQLNAFADSEISVYIITFDDFFYGGSITQLNKDYVLLEDHKIGSIPIPYSNIKKLTKFKSDDRDEDERILLPEKS